MLRVRIKTNIPNYCIAKKFPGAVLRIRNLCKGEKGIKALASVKTPNGRTTIAIDEHRCPLAKRILDSGVIVSSAEISDCIVWNLVCGEDAFRRLSDTVEFELIGKEVFSEKDELTFNEHEMLKFALERGFFDSPKKIKLGYIAEEFGISKSTASETLRRAIRKVLKNYFDL